MRRGGCCNERASPLSWAGRVDALANRDELFSNDGTAQEIWGRTLRRVVWGIAVDNAACFNAAAERE